MAVAIVGASACGSSGGGGGGGTDAHVGSGSDAAVNMNCGYTESDDTGNDNFYGDGDGQPETTGLTFGSAPIVLCGNINSGHYDSDDTLVDYDTFAFTVSGTGDALLEFTAPGADALTSVSVEITEDSALVGHADFIGTHGAASFSLGPDDYQFWVTAINGSAIASSIPYTIKLSTDTFNTRCPAGSTATYTEAHDGSGYGNNMIDMSFDPANNVPTPVLTSSTTDTPENSGITVASGSNYLINGTSADVPENDAIAYLDEDTYAITTGANTNQLAVRVDWVTAGNDDYDWFLFEPNTATLVTSSYRENIVGPEATTISVKPSTAYWLWVAPQTSSGTPEAYGISICGEDFSGL